jgi:hypothetical protein
MRNQVLILIIVLAVAGLFYFGRRPDAPTPVVTQNEVAEETPQDIESRTPPHALPKTDVRTTAPSLGSINKSPPTAQVQTQNAPDENQPPVREYIVEDGVAVAEGDIVIGVPDSGHNTGAAQLAPLTPWPTHEIPYFIQPSVSDPSRIKEAIKLFSETPVMFVPVTNQVDMLVFEEVPGKCKSYVGKMGGKQPIFISPACGPHEIAHELMHALGFMHEQNRADRDHFIQVNQQNIDESELLNFEKLPDTYMTLSGLSEFSYDSIMIYPTSMFSKNGAATMQSTVAGQSIAPSRRLSAQDIQRIQKYYGRR